MARIGIIGATNIDIGGFSTHALRMRDSNPGRIRLTVGGVGRNIACNLAALGQNVEFVTAFADDEFARTARTDLERRGISLRCAQTFPGKASSVYLYIADCDKDMALAVNDMALLDELRPERVEPALPTLNGCDLAIADANLPEETLHFLAERLTVPLMADCVSAAKVARLKPVLSKLCALKPNRVEAQQLTGLPVETVDDAKRAAMALTGLGVRRVFLTLGSKGVVCADVEGAAHLPAPPALGASYTGAGDSFAAAVAYGIAHGHSLRRCARLGLRAASLTSASEENVSPEMCESALTTILSEE